MQQHELKSAPGSRRPAKRIGRGNASGHGTYATKGLKGQKARTGNDLRIGFEGGQMALSARLARKRGFTNKWRIEYEWVNVGQLSRASTSGAVTPQSLAAAGLINRPHLPVKVLGDGQLDKPLTVSAHAFTASARQKIEAAGGRVEQLAGHATERVSRLEAEAMARIETAEAARVEAAEVARAAAAKDEQPPADAEAVAKIARAAAAKDEQPPADAEAVAKIARAAAAKDEQPPADTEAVAKIARAAAAKDEQPPAEAEPAARADGEEQA